MILLSCLSGIPVKSEEGLKAGEPATTRRYLGSQPSRRLMDLRGARAFETQQERLGVEPARKACQLAVGSDHAMARRDDRDRVLAVGSTHRAHRARAADLAGDLRVGAGLAERDGEQRLPDFLLELGAEKIEFQIEGLATTGEIFAELPFGLNQDRMVCILITDQEPNQKPVVIRPEDRRQPVL